MKMLTPGNCLRITSSACTNKTEEFSLIQIRQIVYVLIIFIQCRWCYFLSQRYKVYNRINKWVKYFFKFLKNKS